MISVRDIFCPTFTLIDPARYSSGRPMEKIQDTLVSYDIEEIINGISQKGFYTYKNRRDFLFYTVIDYPIKWVMKNPGKQSTCTFEPTDNIYYDLPEEFMIS